MSHPLYNRSSTAIFLCYHSVAPTGPTYLTVTPELFERQLRLLRDRGLQAGDLATLGRLVAGESIPPTVFLTFDDGFRDNHETAMGLLQEYGMRGIVFVLPPMLDTAAPLRWPEVETMCELYPSTMRSLDWDMVGEMAEGPFDVGSHTLTHPHLGLLSGERLLDELSQSRRRIVERLGSCDSIAYPFGSWTSETAESARLCGYRFAFTLPTRIGQRHASPLSIPRINVDFRDDERRFAFKLSRVGRSALLSPRVSGGRRVVRRARRAPAKAAQ